MDIEGKETTNKPCVKRGDEVSVYRGFIVLRGW